MTLLAKRVSDDKNCKWIYRLRIKGRLRGTAIEKAQAVP